MQVKVPDIRKYKNNLRLKYKSIRKNMPSTIKIKNDDSIFKKIVSLKMYKESDIILTFVSTKIEVNTLKLINYSLKIGKKVAVPKCIDGTRTMVFYLIKSLDDLEVATFSVLEPIVSRCQKLENFNNSICIVPGLAFDIKGYRLGYGKGYYDRFLSNYNGINIGICYCSCTLNNLINGRYDKKVDYLITEKYVKRFRGGIYGKQKR